MCINYVNTFPRFEVTQTFQNELYNVHDMHTNYGKSYDHVNLPIGCSIWRDVDNILIPNNFSNVDDIAFDNNSKTMRGRISKMK